MIDWLLSNRSDLGLNLLAEAIGILFALLVIGRYLAWRDNKNWRSSTHFLFFELFLITNKLMDELAPEWSSSPRLTIGYKFGEMPEIPVAPGQEYADKRLNAEREAFVERTLTVVRQRPLMLSNQRNQLFELLARSQGALAREPELNGLVNKLYGHLRFTAKKLTEELEKPTDPFFQEDPTDERVAWVLERNFEWVARYASDVRRWLEGHATSASNMTDLIHAIEEPDVDEG